MKVILTIFLSLMTWCSLSAQVKLPRLIRDSMILQRNKEIHIWGWASPGEKVTVRFNHKDYYAEAGNDSKWKILLPAMKAGGPYTMEIEGKNRIVLHDILVGDVWFCSGQSNMVHQMELHRVRYKKEIEESDYSKIRQFWIPTLTDLQEQQEDLPTGYWKSANREDVKNFSAVAYFFAKSLYQKYHVPIGLINASVGGSPIQAWMSENSLNDFSSLMNEIEKNKDTAYVNNLKKKAEENHKVSLTKDKGFSGLVPWYDTTYIPEGWRRIGIPGYWEDQGVRDLNGVVWYRREVNIPSSMAGKPAEVFLGRIVDADVLYINGEKVGHTAYQYPQRRYSVPDNLLKAGKNLFVVRVENQSGKGGFVPDKPYYLFTERDTVDLKGYWHYKVGQVFLSQNEVSDEESNFSVQNAPTALYNAMIAPVTDYTIKGFVWYQGASNVGHPENYANLQQAMIGDWRNQWKEGDIPFLYVQLPGYGAYNYLPSESKWAELRNAQLQSLSISHTGMAVTIDLGEWNDIHPDRKEPVGYRLALVAEKVAYGENNVYSRPIFQDFEVEGDSIILSFKNVGDGLIFKRDADSSYISPLPGDVVGGFAIAGTDRKYVWAKAKIEDNKIVVWSPSVKEPKNVRYAWADSPIYPVLYNKNGLPASPFETNK